MTTRKLCYRHHCQEFDKLSNAHRHEAANWLTTGPANCELCKAEGTTKEITYPSYTPVKIIRIDDDGDEHLVDAGYNAQPGEQVLEIMRCDGCGVEFEATRLDAWCPDLEITDCGCTERSAHSPESYLLF